jgi:autotransporter-associated beta strand protein
VDGLVQTKQLTIGGAAVGFTITGNSGAVVLTGTAQTFTGPIDFRGGNFLASATGGVDWSSAGGLLRFASVNGSYTGAFTVTGGDLTIGRAVKVATGPYVFDTGANNLSFTANVVNTGQNSQFVKVGSGNLTISGSGANSFGIGGSGFDLTGTGNWFRAGVTVEQGTLTLNGGAGASYTVGRTAEFVIGDSFSQNAATVLSSGTLNVGAWLTLGRGSATTATTNSLTASGTAIINTLNFSTGFNAGQGLTYSSSAVTLNDSARLIAVNQGNNFNISESPGSRTVITLNGSSMLEYFGGSVTAGGNLIRVGMNGTGVINVASANAVLRANAIMFGESDGGAGALYLKGTLQLAGGANINAFPIGNGTGAYGYVLVDNGLSPNNVVNLSEFGIGASGGGNGILEVRSGNVVASTWVTPLRGATSNQQGLLNITGGTFTLANSTQNAVQIQAGNVTGQFQFNVTGSGQLIGGNLSSLDLLRVANADSRELSVLNASNGGTVQLGQITVGTTNGVALVNSNAGIFRATATQTNFIDGRIRATTIYSGGMTMDTNGFAVGIKGILAGATGSGVGSIALSGTGSNYVGAPLIQLVGGGGLGATAVAVFNEATGQVTGITVTNPGTGYTSAPTVLISGGAGSYLTATATLAANATDGGLTKKGLGTLTLGAANTYVGGTRVLQGGLTLDFTAVAPAAGSGVNVENGGYAFAPIDNILAPTGTLTLNATPLAVIGRETLFNTQTLGGLVLQSAQSTIALTAGANGSVVLNAGPLSRAAGTTLRLDAGTNTGFSTTSTNVNGILGGWFTAGTAGFATTDGTRVTALATYGSTLTPASTPTSSPPPTSRPARPSTPSASTPRPPRRSRSPATSTCSRAVFSSPRPSPPRLPGSRAVPSSPARPNSSSRRTTRRRRSPSPRSSPTTVPPSASSRPAPARWSSPASTPTRATPTSTPVRSRSARTACSARPRRSRPPASSSRAAVSRPPPASPWTRTAASCSARTPSSTPRPARP